jgi:radical SAM protein with 4Fe4S-binding SPASM domain
MPMDHLFPYENYINLSDHWILYPNQTSNILYKISLSDSKHFVIDGRDGVILSLLNEELHTYQEFIVLIADLFSFPSFSSTEKYLHALFVKLNKDEDVIVNSPTKIEVRNSYNPDDFIIEKNTFLYPKRMKTPIRLLIFPTGKCTTDCIYCYADLKNLRKRKDMSIEQWRIIFEQARELGIKTIDISGGDIFARNDAVEFICELIKYDFLFFLSTKSYISGLQAKAISDAGFNKHIHGVRREVQLSVDCGDNEISKILVRRDNYLERMKKTAVHLMNAGISPKVKSVITPLNAEHVKEVIMIFKELGIKEFQITKYDASLYRHKEKYELTPEQENYIKSAMKEIASANPDINIQGNLIIHSEQEELSGISKTFHEEGESNRPQTVRAEKSIYDTTGCSAGRTMLGITPDGQACLCEQMKMEEPFVFGDFKKQSIMELWNSPEIKQICFPKKDNFLNTPCYDCDLFKECVIINGQCFRDNYFGRNPDKKKGNLFHQTNNCYQQQQNKV